MRTIPLFIFYLFIIVSAPAQTSNAEGPAKTYIKLFWSSIEKMKDIPEEKKLNQYTMQTKNAGSALKNIKKMDPAYNTADMEAELKKWQDELAKLNNKRSEKSAAIANTSTYLNDLFKAPTTTEFRSTGDINNDIQKHIVQLKNYNEKLNKFLESVMDRKR